MIHFAKLETAPRLRRALSVLEAYPQGVTTKEWERLANICAGGTVASELRKQLRKHGLTVHCHYERRTAQGGSVFRYTLERISEQKGKE